MLSFGRDICGDLGQASQREWLVTNGLGGFAMGTIARLLTRGYHGLLIAARRPPLRRVLLVAKLDETATHDGHIYPLYANHWASGVVEATGPRWLERFHLEGTTPVWTFALGDALLEKRVWMHPGANTTYVRYQARRATMPIGLSLTALVNQRDYHAPARADSRRMRVEPVADGLRVTPAEGAAPFFLLSGDARVSPAHVWHHGFFLSAEADRGLPALDDHLHVGTFTVTLQPGQTVTLIASTEAGPLLDGTAAYAVRLQHEHDLLDRAGTATAPVWRRQFVLAADQFIVRRSLPDGTTGTSVIAGYPWFTDWGRDTMIALPGLTLTTGRPAVAASLLRTFARHVDGGLLPNRFPDGSTEPEYNTIDATLWFIQALRAYHVATGDDDLLTELWPVLADIITWHQHGTRHGIRVDPVDGLLTGGETGVQLTWMDARVDGRVVTPRIGKPVEVNALWHNALRVMAAFAHHLGQSEEPYTAAADRVAAGFSRYWNPATGCLFDVLDGPTGDDPSVRPNQLLAVSLPHALLEEWQQRAVVETCTRHLLTSYGPRTLAPDDPAYHGRHAGGQRTRDAAYHQGTVWAWLIEPFVRAHLRVYGDPALARSFLMPLIEHLRAAGLGSISEIFDGDAPHHPRGCPAQAWSVAAVLAAWQATATPPAPHPPATPVGSSPSEPTDRWRPVVEPERTHRPLAAGGHPRASLAPRRTSARCGVASLGRGGLGASDRQGRRHDPLAGQTVLL